MTSESELARAVEVLRVHARTFATLSIRAKSMLLRQCVDRVASCAEDWVREACAAKQISFDAPVAAEEWLAGPMTTARNLRLLVESLDQINSEGRPRLPAVSTERDGRTAVDVFPASAFDKIIAPGFSCKVMLQPGWDHASLLARQASFYHQSSPSGEVCVVLGAGNVSSIPPMDALYKMFVDGAVCVVKMNPVNEWVGPWLERALSSLIEAGFLRIVYGGAEVGQYLCNHPLVDSVHITGSDKTHDAIVWGSDPVARDARKARNEPLLRKTITSELGNVSPVAIVPGDYEERELWCMARNLATMVVNNASFNCNAGKMLITGQGWPQRARFLEMLERALAQVPPRVAYYPGAESRYQQLTAKHEKRAVGEVAPGQLPWTLVLGLRAKDTAEPLFCTEPFCCILSEVSIASADPAHFLEELAPFCNDRLWGTLSAAIMISPRAERDVVLEGALQQAVRALRYGTVAINHWPAVSYAFVTPPWGGHPSATLNDIQSGLGWVHNTFMLEGIEKAILRGPLVPSPKPVWFYDHRYAHEVGRRVTAFECSPSALRVPALAYYGMRG